MKITLNKLKELSFELYGMGFTNIQTGEFKVLTEGVLKQSLDLKSKHFLSKFAKSLGDLFPDEEAQQSPEFPELMKAEVDISDHIKQLPKDLFEKLGSIQTKEEYPILMDIAASLV
jgi:hypothetical protein